MEGLILQDSLSALRVTIQICLSCEHKNSRKGNATAPLAEIKHELLCVTGL